MREESWKRKLSFTFTHLLKRTLNAAFPGPAVSPVPQTPLPQHAPDVKLKYVTVGIPEAVAELSIPGSSEAMNHINAATIDLLQKGLLSAIRIENESQLRYLITPAGKQYL